MLIVRRSMFTGKTHSMDLPVTIDQIRMWENGVLIQNAFPHLSPGEREFIKTGVTPQEWDETFGKPE